MAPVKCVEPKEGEYLLVIAAQQQACKDEANARLSASKTWYDDLSERVATPKASTP